MNTYKLSQKWLIAEEATPKCCTLREKKIIAQLLEIFAASYGLLTCSQRPFTHLCPEPDAVTRKWLT
jgi:hypothetical protein